jgi:phosphatidylinositol phospholipase C delta
MFLNSALFELNGNCGYILKPEYLRTGNGSLLKSTQTGSKVNSKKIRVKIYSASNLPTEKFEVVDPYVLVSVVTPSSQKKKEHLAIYRIIP